LTSGNNDITLRKASLSDADAIKRLADAHRHELGFVRHPAIIESISRNELIVAYNSSGIIGFIEYHHRQDVQTTLYHIVVEIDHRGMGVGRSLLAVLQEEARQRGKQTVRIKCPIDLPANGFYERVGCSLLTCEKGKSRQLAVWALLTSGLAAVCASGANEDS